MENDVTCRRLARELGLDRVKVKSYVRYRKLGRTVGSAGMGRNIVLTEAEAEIVRKELKPRLELPTVEKVEADTGQRIYSTVEAARELDLCHDTVLKYGHTL